MLLYKHVELYNDSLPVFLYKTDSKNIYGYWLYLFCFYTFCCEMSFYKPLWSNFHPESFIEIKDAANTHLSSFSRLLLRLLFTMLYYVSVGLFRLVLPLILLIGEWRCIFSFIIQMHQSSFFSKNFLYKCNLCYFEFIWLIIVSHHNFFSVYYSTKFVLVCLRHSLVTLAICSRTH